MIVIQNAVIHSMDKPVIKNGYIIIEGRRIQAVGSMDGLMPEIAPDAAVIDAEGAVVTPGLVDAHSHIGLWEDGISREGADGNEETDPVYPHLRALDAINPMDAAFGEALCAGVTTVVVGPGSANPLGGQILAMKTMGHRIDDMVVKEPLAIKAAFGENPKLVYDDKDQAPSTRMATAAILRETLQKARDYAAQWEKYEANPAEETRPDIDLKYEALRPVLARELPIHAHVHRADDIFTAIRIAKEFDLNLVLVHCTEGHLIADDLRKEGYPVLAGPILTDRSKPELRNQSETNPAVLTAHGVKTAIITDHPETPEKYLPLCAAVAVREGLPPEEGLRAITRYPAEICGIFDRVGSLTPGKDADIVIWDGDPLSAVSKPRAVFCEGVAQAPMKQGGQA